MTMRVTSHWARCVVETTWRLQGSTYKSWRSYGSKQSQLPLAMYKRYEGRSLLIRFNPLIRQRNHRVRDDPSTMTPTPILNLPQGSRLCRWNEPCMGEHNHINLSQVMMYLWEYQSLIPAPGYIHYQWCFHHPNISIRYSKSSNYTYPNTVSLSSRKH